MRPTTMLRVLGRCGILGLVTVLCRRCLHDSALCGFLVRISFRSSTRSVQMDVEGAKEAAIASRVEPDNPTPQASKTVREKIGATDTHLLEEDREHCPR